MADRRDVWIQLFAAALGGVAAGSPGLTEVGTTQRAGKIADAALKELDARAGTPFFSAPPASPPKP
jgi:hypothetical protein